MNYRELADVLAKNAAVRVTTSVTDRLMNYIRASRWCARPVAAITVEGSHVAIYTPFDYASRGVEDQVSDSHVSVIIGYRVIYVKTTDHEMILLCDEIKHDDE
ncbi:hypothetical protein [Pyrobaculum sp.]|uniref:hypothetical protein n=1 Tax=Pyrobaculum sp. TaxID=2004705 RepID=UPI003D0EFCEE